MGIDVDTRILTRELMSVAELAGLRTAVTDHFGHHQLDEDVAGDVQLVCSELVTNALTHGRAGSVVVTVRVDDDVTTLVVSTDGIGIGDDVPAVMPGPDAITGRGRAIAGLLATTLTTTVAADQRNETVATFDHPEPDASARKGDDDLDSPGAGTHTLEIRALRRTGRFVREVSQDSL